MKQDFRVGFLAGHLVDLLCEMKCKYGGGIMDSQDLWGVNLYIPATDFKNLLEIAKKLTDSVMQDMEQP